ncbi:hypothetical protein FNL37_1773 [Methylovorus glucosotrophus]|uniref:hypothetical protein n=1 Tax=Methylovorus glucosotrophus TaxID=266009 RepID=UPI001331BB95|nr:hypothetical protein [Methylovorus glucosotrophus]KAF0844329.1 hypothetical protein FNL37_1773 [Methylovorus glucosotrophus]
MKVTLPYVVALVKRGEGSKTPVTIFPHEVEVLRMQLGEDAVEVTDDAPPIAEGSFDTEDEYVRLQEYYRGNGDEPNPTTRVWRNLSEFEADFGPVVGDDKQALLAEALALGIKANKNWGIEKLTTAIEEAKAAE